MAWKNKGLEVIRGEYYGIPTKVSQQITLSRNAEYGWRRFKQIM